MLAGNVSIISLSFPNTEKVLYRKVREDVRKFIYYYFIEV